MNSLFCYMCSAKATSREHAPPRCLFPASADTVNGLDYRKNLITVPSCEEHNSKKSHDDEYLLFVLSGSYASSEVGLTQFLTKAGRAFEKEPTKAAKLIKRATPVLLSRSGGATWEKGAQIIIEGARIDGVLDNCARALYHQHTGSKFQGVSEVFTNFTMYLNQEYQASVTKLFEDTAREMAVETLHGENPVIFSYRFKETQSTVLFYLCFYGKSTAIIRFKRIIVYR